jgi:hypothetical protein
MVRASMWGSKALNEYGKAGSVYGMAAFSLWMF